MLIDDFGSGKYCNSAGFPGIYVLFKYLVNCSLLILDMSLYYLLEMSSYCVFRNFDYLSDILG